MFNQLHLPSKANGLLHLLLHTSASLSLNENADSSVRVDVSRFINQLVPESFPYSHILEGADDMPAHIKSMLLGVSLTIRIQQGHLTLGTWQGIFLGEHRNNAGSRRIAATFIQ